MKDIPSASAWPLVSRWGAFAAFVAALLVIRQTDPTDNAWLPRCPLHYLTGWHCPGCGATRAAHALLHGDVVEAFSQNPLLVCLLPAVLGICLWHFCAHGSWTAWTSAVSPRWIWLTLFVLLVFGVLRNVPAYPFTLLAPH